MQRERDGGFANPTTILASWSRQIRSAPGEILKHRWSIQALRPLCSPLRGSVCPCLQGGSTSSVAWGGIAPHGARGVLAHDGQDDAREDHALCSSVLVV